MTGDQVVRAAIIKQMNGFSYELLAFHLTDSRSYRAFCGIGLGEVPPKRATLAENVARLTADTWAEIHRVVVADALRRGVETADRVRFDATAVDANIRMSRIGSIDGSHLPPRLRSHGPPLDIRTPATPSAF